MHNGTRVVNCDRILVGRNQKFWTEWSVSRSCKVNATQSNPNRPKNRGKLRVCKVTIQISRVHCRRPRGNTQNVPSRRSHYRLPFHYLQLPSICIDKLFAPFTLPDNILFQQVFGNLRKFVLVAFGFGTSVELSFRTMLLWCWDKVETWCKFCFRPKTSEWNGFSIPISLLDRCFYTISINVNGFFFILSNIRNYSTGVSRARSLLGDKTKWNGSYQKMFDEFGEFECSWAELNVANGDSK